MPDSFSISPPPTRPLTLPREQLAGGAVLGLFGPWRPPITLALPIAERVRVALMRASGPSVPWQISGKDDHGQPRRGHDHLYLLPFSSGDAPGSEPCVDRVLLWATGGLEPATRAAVERLAAHGGWIQAGGRPRLRLELLALGSREALGQCTPTPVLGPARAWTSATSFVPPRFPKRRRGELLDEPGEQLAHLATAVLGHTPQTVRPAADHGERWAAFTQARIEQAQGPRRPAGAWVLRFAAPVSGPVVLGYGAHYGLGRFEALTQN